MAHYPIRLRYPLLAILALALAGPLFAHGDKVIPQIADGFTSDGQVYRTRFDITNLGPDQTTRITNVKVEFYRSTGEPWSIATNLGTAFAFTLDLGKYQTVRVETQGAGNLATGYAIVRNFESTTPYPEDYEVAITAYYEIRKGNVATETIGVPIGQPTVSFVFPAQTNLSTELLTGFAIANLANTSNNVTLELWSAGTTTSASATLAGTTSVPLNPRQQQARFLNEFFPSIATFRGMVRGRSEKPVSILALLQTPSTPPSKQYATLVPAYIDALRRNTAMYLQEGLPLDADLPVSDYYINEDTGPWDLLYETVDTTSRRLTPQGGAAFALIGQRTDAEFDDNVTITYLQGLTYSTSSISMSNGSANLQSGFTFAVRTGLGRYVKIRVAVVVQRDTYRDLVLEMYVYK